MIKSLLGCIVLGAPSLQALPTPSDYNYATFLDLGPGNPYEPLYGTQMNAEGIDIGPDGNMYLSRVFKGSVWKVTPEGNLSIYAQLPTLENARMSAIEFNEEGDLFVTYYSFIKQNPLPPLPAPQYTTTAYNGVWQVKNIDGFIGTKKVFPLHGEKFSFADGIAIDKAGNVYVSDPDWGNIWKFDPNDLCKPGVLWAGTDYCTGINCPPNYLDGLGLFAPQGELTNLYGRGFGVNDLALNEDDGYLYAASSERGLLVRIPILKNGKSGPQEVIYSAGAFVDGTFYDKHKKILYASLTLSYSTFTYIHTVVGARAHHSNPMNFAPVLNDPLLGVPTDVHNGRKFGHGNNKKLYVVNYGDAVQGIPSSVVVATPN